MDNPTRQEFDELKFIVNNHKHQQYDQTKSLGITPAKYVIWRVLDYTTSQTTGTTFGGDFEVPFDGSITNIYAYVDTAGVTSTATIDVNKNGTTILSTKITIDSTEKTSRTAATPPVISNDVVNVGDILTVDIDAIQTTPAKGLVVVLIINT